jgi:hypothetical protein
MLASLVTNSEISVFVGSVATPNACDARGELAGANAAAGETDKAKIRTKLRNIMMRYTVKQIQTFNKIYFMCRFDVRIERF